MAKQNEINLFV